MEEAVIPIAVAFTMSGFAIAMGFIMGDACGHNKAKTDMQDEAVRLGKAEYFIDENNQRQWRWKP